jgi:hypothetical protein
MDVKHDVKTQTSVIIIVILELIAILCLQGLLNLVLYTFISIMCTTYFKLRLQNFCAWSLFMGLVWVSEYTVNVSPDTDAECFVGGRN